MKQQFATILFFLHLICLYLPVSAQNNLAFRVDLAAEESVDEVGLRGNLPPLSWEESVPMTDPDGDGVYTVSIEFPSVEAGDTLEYKFLKDGAWERQDKGNRTIVMGGAQVLPIAEWQLYTDEFLFERIKSLNFAKYIFIYSSGKKRGLSPEEIAQEVIDFYSWRPHNWPAKPQDLLRSIPKAQAGQQGGYFKVLEDRPGKVKFIMGRYWRNWFDLYGASIGLDENGLIQGVSQDDLETQYRSWLEHYCQKNGKDWKLQIEAQGESKWVVTISTE